MLHARDNSILLALIAFTSVILLLVGLLIMFVLVQQKKKLVHDAAIDNLQSQFNQTLLASTLEIQEQIMAEISQEIHDNIGQVLTLAKLYLTTTTAAETTQTENKIPAAKELIARAIRDLRNLSHTLNKDYLHSIGLLKGIENELLVIQRSGIYITEMTVTGEHYNFSKQTELILFRMIQEVLTNIIKHAKATHITVSVLFTAENTLIKITDDGIGCEDPTKFVADKQNAGIGLSNIKHRAKLIGATFLFESEKNRGTKVIFTVPNQEKC